MEDPEMTINSRENVSSSKKSNEDVLEQSPVLNDLEIEPTSCPQPSEKNEDKKDIFKEQNCLKEDGLVNGKVIPKIGDNGIVSHILSQEKAKTESHISCSTNVMGDHFCLQTNFEDITKTTDSISNIHISDELSASDDTEKDFKDGLEYVVYKSESQMPDIMRLITRDLSEPYSIYTYRYFIHNWPKLCFLAMDEEKCVGAIVCKLDMHKKMVRRGYIAMLAIDADYRRRKIGSHLVLKAIRAMIKDDCDEVVLETEITNKPALRLYENLGFVRDKRLFRYYLNGVDALRLKLWLR